MTSRGTEVKFRCEQDCLQCGCPGHTVIASYDHPSDFYRVDFDAGKYTAYFDEARLLAMIEAISKINWGSEPKLSLEVAAERERCAKVAKTMDTPHHMYTRACREIEARIRSGE